MSSLRLHSDLALTSKGVYSAHEQANGATLHHRRETRSTTRRPRGGKLEAAGGSKSKPLDRSIVQSSAP